MGEVSELSSGGVEKRSGLKKGFLRCGGQVKSDLRFLSKRTSGEDIFKKEGDELCSRNAKEGPWGHS